MSLRRSTLALTLAVACVHFVATLAALLGTFGTSMERFDSGRSPTLLESAADAAFGVLSFPILPLLDYVPMRFPGALGYVPFVVNSVIWGIAIAFASTVLRKRRNV